VRVLLRVRYLNKLQEDKKFQKQEQAREFYRNRGNDDDLNAMDMGEITSVRLQEEIVAHEKDLEVVESLLSIYTQPKMF
jgi:hypothetical protein